MNIAQSKRALAVPAVLAALALTACQDAAPTAAPPTPVSPTASQTADPTAEQSESSSSPSSEETPSESSSSSTSSTSEQENSGATCNGRGSFTLKKEGAEAKPQDAVQTVNYRSGDGQAEVSFGKPTIDTSGGDTFFPGEGMQTVIYPVTIKMTGGRSFISTRLSLGLVDAQDNPCDQDTLAAVVSRADQVPVEVMKPGDTMSKKIAFAIPAGAKLEDYSLLFASDYSSGKAEHAWKAK
ncbi:hypothetical protein [Demetria terragena]|uniref:hypothetical protein n=1 Tax=Demetria terragena TaxID=63959 RepID=UPI000373FCB4|nr:hypothetical protein [Demetria terragena]